LKVLVTRTAFVMRLSLTMHACGQLGWMLDGSVPERQEDDAGSNAAASAG
jgi:hypothetical protein